MQFWKRQRQIAGATEYVRARAGHKPFANSQATKESSSLRHIQNQATEQRLSVESNFRRMSEQHDRARAMILGPAPLNYRRRS